MKMTLEDLKELQALGSVIFTDCSVQILFGVGGGGMAGEVPEDSGYQGCAIGFDTDQPVPEEFEETTEEPEDDDYIEVPAGTAICKHKK